MHPKQLIPFFISIFSGVGAQVLFKGNCPYIPPMANFSPDEFLGRWYEIERFFVSYETFLGSCWVENYLFHEDRGYFTRLEWKERIYGMTLAVENGVKYPKKNLGLVRYMVQRPAVEFLHGQYIIIDTDYSTYALVWKCEELPGKIGHTQILWLLSKYQTPPKKSIQRAKYISSRLGLKVSKLKRQNRMSCSR